MHFLKKTFRILSKYSGGLFLVSLFLLKIPPFYIFFPIRSSLSTTLSLSAFIILILFATSLYESFVKKSYLAFKSNFLIIIFLIYFFSQSISVINTSHIDYITKSLALYKNIFLSGAALFLTLRYKISHKSILVILFLAASLNFLYQMLMLFETLSFWELAQIFIYEPHLQFISMNLQRSRLFIETYDEIITPFIVILLVQAKQRHQKMALFSLLLMVFLPSLLSRFRTRVLMFSMAFLSSIIFVVKKKPAFKINFVVLLFTFALIGNILLSSTTGYSFIERFTFQGGEQDLQSIESRFENIIQSLDIGLKEPLLGVGLENYASSIEKNEPDPALYLNWQEIEPRIAASDPHNILAKTLAETGIFGLAIFILIMSHFFVDDFKSLRNKSEDQYKKGYIISFWTLFLYSLFNPTTTLGYNVLFWVLRGLI